MAKSSLLGRTNHLLGCVAGFLVLCDAHWLARPNAKVLAAEAVLNVIKHSDYDPERPAPAKGAVWRQQAAAREARNILWTADGR